MRNEYTDYIAHGHKYFAVIDLGKKNSKGTKLRRYFYSANEYKNYLAGKKTLDDKLMDATAKAYKKVKGIASTAKALPKLAKAAKETSKMTEGDKKAANVEGRAKRAGLKTDEGWYFGGQNNLYKEATDKKGNKYLINSEDRKVYSYDGSKEHRKYVMNKGDSGEGKDQSKELIKKEAQAKKEESKKPEPKAAKKGTALGNAIREDFMERMIEKGINKANAEAMRKKLEGAYQTATTIGTSANDIKKRIDSVQDAVLSGDYDKLDSALEDMIDDHEKIQNDIITIVDSLIPGVKNINDEFKNINDEFMKRREEDMNKAESSYNDALKKHNEAKAKSDEEIWRDLEKELDERIKKNRK